MWKGLNKQHIQKQSYSNCQGESSVRLNLQFQYKSVSAGEWKRNMGRDKCPVRVELLNAEVEPFSCLHNPWSIKTKGKQRKSKILRSTRVWFHAEVFTWKALVLPLVMLFSFLYLQTKISECFTHINKDSESFWDTHPYYTHFCRLQWHRVWLIKGQKMSQQRKRTPKPQSSIVCDNHWITSLFITSQPWE